MINDDESVPSSCILLLLGVLMREKEVWSLLKSSKIPLKVVHSVGVFSLKISSHFILEGISLEQSIW